MTKLKEFALNALKKPLNGVHTKLRLKKLSNVNAGAMFLIFASAVVLNIQPSGAFAAGTSGNSSVTTAASYSKSVNIPPRLQWEANFGYCGEVAMISAGLYFGQYVSQFDARKIASKNANQSTEGSQLLLGVNDAYAAAQMHLSAKEWKGGTQPNANNFLAWVKQNVVSGIPVMIGVYDNQFLLEGSTNPLAGDAEYDHIVPVTGISSTHPLGGPSTYFTADLFTFSDNGLWSPTGVPAYFYQYPAGTFQASRTAANSQSGPIYSLAKRGNNYGIAITGIIDRDGKALPVRVATSSNFEMPAMQEGSNKRPAPQTLTLTVTVSGLQPSLTYNLYRYNNFQSVPNTGFNANASKASKKWQVSINSGSTYSVTENISSDEIAVYRAVPTTAP